MSESMTREIREILRVHGRLANDVSGLADESDLYQAGLTSLASVDLMLALEDCFRVEFPERLLRRGSFATILSIKSALEELTGAGA